MKEIAYRMNGGKVTRIVRKTKPRSIIRHLMILDSTLTKHR